MNFEITAESTLAIVKSLENLNEMIDEARHRAREMGVQPDHQLSLKPQVTIVGDIHPSEDEPVTVRFCWERVELR